jgi:hypothetical protein
MKRTLIITCAMLLGAGLASAQITNTSTPALAIPDNTCATPTYATDTIAFTETGTITDVNVRVAITHTWRSDLQFFVDYSVGGGPVALVAPPGYGSLNDNFYATFDDAAALPCSDLTMCGGGGTACVGPAPGVTCQPNALLSAFNTLASPGTWTISVCDDAAGDLGTLDEWAVTLDGPGLPVELMSFQVN